MKRFKRILFCPLGRRGNKGALRRVSDLAEANNASLTLMGVVPEPSGVQRLWHRAEIYSRIRDSERQTVTANLARWMPKDSQVQPATVLEIGSPALAIVGQVLRADHDLVIVTSDEDAEDQATIKRLLRKCPCPVWVIRPTRARTQRILAAVNPGPDGTDLNLMILELAAAMAEQYGGDVHVVNAWQLYGEATLRSSAFIRTTPSEIQEMIDTEKTECIRELNKLLKSPSIGPVDWQVHVIKGSPAQVIEALIARERINLLVMGTVARTGIPGLLMGNTAEQVLDEVRCSVIAVKPPGFVSPLATEAT
jgi:universal stress protein E